MMDDKEERTGINQNNQQLINSESIVNQRMASIAGGFLDFALFVADVEHLKFILDTGKEDVKNYDLLLGLLITSLSLQVIVGVLLFIVGFRNNSNQTKEEAKWTQIVNQIVVGLVSVIALINVFITTFGDRGETVARFRTRHNCDLTSMPINYDNNSEIFRK